MKKKCSRFRRSEMQFVIASEARSNHSTHADRGISGELQAKIGVNLPKCFATQSKLRLSYKIDIKPAIDENTPNCLALPK